MPGAPSVVLTDPAQVLGSEADTVLAFWRHLDQRSEGPQGSHYQGDLGKAEDRLMVLGSLVGKSAPIARARGAVYGGFYDNYLTNAFLAGNATTEIILRPDMEAHGREYLFLPKYGFDSPQDVLDKVGRD